MHWGKTGSHIILAESEYACYLTPGTSFNIDCTAEAPSGADELILKIYDDKPGYYGTRQTTSKSRGDLVGTVALVDGLPPPPNVMNRSHVHFEYSQPNLSLDFSYENPLETRTIDMTSYSLILYDSQGIHLEEVKLETQQGTIQLAPYASSEYHAETTIETVVWQDSYYYLLSYLSHPRGVISSGAIQK